MRSGYNCCCGCGVLVETGESSKSMRQAVLLLTEDGGANDAGRGGGGGRLVFT